MGEVKIIRPQPGYQEKALSSSADIVIGGGAAGVGKTFTLLMDPLRDVDTPRFGGVIFRRTRPQIRNEGGLWDTSLTLYRHMHAVASESVLEWRFRKGTRLRFSPLQYEKDIYEYQGAQICFIGFDELTHFTKKMFFYLLTRNRSVCGVKPYVRATCNPDPESWVFELIKWWIDPLTGYPIPERNGVIRYFMVDGDNYIWGDTIGDVLDKSHYLIGDVAEKSGIDPKEFVKSITFVSGSIYDNKELLKNDPAYLGNLMAQDDETKAQLLHGNWKVVISELDVFDYYKFIGVFENKYEVNREGRYITADIATKGSDKFIVGCWYGSELMDILIMDKSNGPQVVEGIVEMAKRHKVPNDHILYDADGVGSLLDGFIVGAIAFNNGGKPLLGENYEHLKAQCYYRAGDACNKGLMRVNEEVANMMYDDKMTIRQRFMYERKAIKRAKADSDGKLCIIKKEQMKIKLNGESPDLMDMFMMRQWFSLEEPWPEVGLLEF